MDEIKSHIDARYRDFINELILFRFQLILPIGIVLQIAFFGLDKVAYPVEAIAFLKIRIVIGVASLILVFITFAKGIKQYIVWFADLGVGFFIMGLAAMVFISNGSSSRYYEGANLVFIGYSIINPFYIWHLIVCFLIWIGYYDVVIILYPGKLNLLNLFFANYFMGSTALLMAILSKFYKDQHYKAFVRQEQLKINEETLIMDIAKRKQVEEELARSNKELEQFAYVASHDLQEPLRMVASFCQKLEKKYKDKLDQDANEYINFAVDGAKRMKALIDALLSYARVGKKELEIKPVDLNKVLGTILHDLEMVTKEKHATIKAGSLPVVMADEIQMTQLFQNFLTNALKFKGEKDPVIEISGRKEGNGWEFKVSDNGIGIDEKHFPKIFEIFQRVHERGAYPGTGIGLALCKKIIENFNGKVWVSSKVGQGTTFYFTLNVKEALV